MPAALNRRQSLTFACVALPLPGALWDELKAERLLPAHTPEPRCEVAA